jgi:putative two-component system response regulator
MRSAPSEHEATSQKQLEAAQQQLLQYARDLNRVFQTEHEKEAARRATTRQLLSFAQDLNRAFRAEQEKARELERAYHDTLQRLLRASHYKDQDTGVHTQRLAHYARTLALFLGWTRAEAERLFAATPMHDLGKIGVPDAVLFKPGPLDENEWKVLKRHTSFGASLLAGSTSALLEMARKIALYHHERWDGSGYPHGLRGEEIPQCAHLVMLADQYDALRSERPYKPGLSHERVRQILLEGDGRTLPQHFQPLLLEAFRELQGKFEEIYERFRAPGRRAA